MCLSEFCAFNAWLQYLLSASAIYCNLCSAVFPAVVFYFVCKAVLYSSLRAGSWLVAERAILFIVTLPPFAVFDTLITLSPFPLSFFNTLPHFKVGLKLNVSAFALKIVHVAAAPVIDMTKRANIKTLTVLNIVFFHYNSSIVS